MKEWQDLLRQFPEKLRLILERSAPNYQSLREIRIRAGKPVILILRNKEYFLSEDGRLLEHPLAALFLGGKEIKAVVDYLARYSLYAYEPELRQGFLTLKGGHRVGIAGEIVSESDKVKNFKYITSLNIRVSHQVIGAGDLVLPYLFSDGKFLNTLIVSPPGCGKTTLLRDVVRQVSGGYQRERGYTIGVVDERSEIGASYMGIPQHDLGIRTDILDCCPKAEGMMMLIRSMAPEIVAVDEIGGEGDSRAIENAVRSGCRILATIHGKDMEEVREKRAMKELVADKLFERYVFLEKKEEAGKIRMIIGKDFEYKYKSW